MNDLHEIINSIASGIAILGVLWIAAVKMTRLEVKVETMWEFTVKRSIVEGVHSKLLSANSPVRLEPHSAELFIHLADELREFGKDNTLKETDLALAIERKFGTRLLHEICIPNNLPYGVCLLMATAISKGGHSLTEVLDEYQVPKKQ